MSFFGPNYGAAQAHVEKLLEEREEFVAANVAQAASIQALKAELSACKEDLRCSHEQLEVANLLSAQRSQLAEEARCSQTPLTAGPCVSGPRHVRLPLTITESPLLLHSHRQGRLTKSCL